MSRDLTDHLGLTIVDIAPHDSRWVDAFLKKILEVDEAELIRLDIYRKSYPNLIKRIKTVIETNHNLYLTMVTMNGRVFQKLSKEEQRIIQEEAKLLAIAERELSIKQENETRGHLEKMGIKLLKMSNEDRLILSAASKKTKEMYKSTLQKWFERIESEYHSSITPNLSQID